MPLGNTYREYKRKTQHVVQWVVTATRMIQAASTSRVRTGGHRYKKGQFKLTQQPGATHNVVDNNPTISQIVTYIELIAEHLKTGKVVSTTRGRAVTIVVPEATFGLLQDVIKARRATFMLYSAMGQADRGHLWVIQKFEEAFALLGGQEWNRQKLVKKRARLKTKARKHSATTGINSSRVGGVTNMFEYLAVNDDRDSISTDEDDHHAPPSKAKAKGK